MSKWLEILLWIVGFFIAVAAIDIPLPGFQRYILSLIDVVLNKSGAGLFWAINKALDNLIGQVLLTAGVFWIGSKIFFKK